MNQVIIKIEGMSCNHCKMNVEKVIKAEEGIKEATVDLEHSQVKIIGDKIDLDRVKRDVESIGYKYAGEVGV